MQQPLSILVLAYVFPPDAGSGTYRTLYFANHWARMGDHVTIVTVKEQCFLPTAITDLGLCKEVHPSIRVMRASAVRPLHWLLKLRSTLRREAPENSSADPGTEISRRVLARRTHRIFHQFKDTVTDLLSCPDEHVGWIPGAVRCGYRIIRSTHVDCIYATGGPWSCLLAATLLQKVSRTPLILDFRDPWISNPNLTARSPVSRWIQRRMESMCIRSAKTVIANTEELRRDFTSRYVDLDHNRFVTITNGFEDAPRQYACPSERFSLVHAGAIYRPRNPLNLLRAVSDLVKDGTIPAQQFRVQLVGGLDDLTADSELRSEAVREVLETTPRVSHDEAVALQQRASALLLIQTGFPLQVPRKLYEYLSLARPVLAIAERDSATARLVRELHLGYVVDDDVDSIKVAILALYENWKSGAAFSIDPEKLRAFHNRHLAGRVRDIMLGPSRTS